MPRPGKKTTATRLLRLGPNPLYTSFADVAQAVVRLTEIVETGLRLRQESTREEIA